MTPQLNFNEKTKIVDPTIIFSPNAFAVTQITLSAPGTGYSPATTATINGSSTTPATVSISPSLVQLNADSSIGGSGNLNIPVVAGGFGLTKVGAGTVTLTGTSTYTGTTEVAAGTLLVNGSTAQPSNVTVDPGAKLGGFGTVKGSVNVLGTLAPGAASAPTTLNVSGNLNFNPSNLASPGTLALNLIGGSGADRIIDSGASVNLTGATLSLTTSGTINNGDTFTILQTTGVITGMFNNGSFITVGAQTFSIDYGSGSGNVVLTAVAPVNPTVTGVVLNGGLSYIDNTLAAAQHSMVENVVYSFSSPVNLTAANFTITGLAGSGTTIVPTLNVSGSAGNTVWTVTFSGAGVNSATNSIGDGEYQLLLSGVSGLTDNTFDFYRLMGDLDGTGLVNIADFNTMVGTFLRATNDPAYLGAADLDGDGAIGIGDINLLVGNFLHSVPQPLPN